VEEEGGKVERLPGCGLKKRKGWQQKYSGDQKEKKFITSGKDSPTKGSGTDTSLAEKK